MDPLLLIFMTVLLLLAPILMVAESLQEMKEKRTSKLAALEAKSRELEETLGLDLTPTAVIAENERIIRRLDDSLMPMLSSSDQHKILTERISHGDKASVWYPPNEYPAYETVQTMQRLRMDRYHSCLRNGHTSSSDAIGFCHQCGYVNDFEKVHACVSGPIYEELVQLPYNKHRSRPRWDARWIQPMDEVEWVMLRNHPQLG